MSISILSSEPPIPLDDMQDTPLGPHPFVQEKNPFTPQKRESTIPTECLQQISSKALWNGHGKHHRRLTRAHTILNKKWGIKYFKLEDPI